MLLFIFLHSIYHGRICHGSDRISCVLFERQVFEMAKEDHHDHMVRVDTGEVIEFFDDQIERLQREIVDRHGYVLEEHSLVLYVRPK